MDNIFIISIGKLWPSLASQTYSILVAEVCGNNTCFIYRRNKLNYRRRNLDLLFCEAQTNFDLMQLKLNVLSALINAKTLICYIYPSQIASGLDPSPEYLWNGAATAPLSLHFSSRSSFPTLANATPLTRICV